jgi:type VI secretion system protein ImpH
LILGPLSLGDFRCFLPGSPRLRRLVAFVRTYAGDELAWDLNLVLKRREVPKLTLAGGGQLGWTTWLPGTGGDRDPDNLVLEPLRAG